MDRFSHALAALAVVAGCSTSPTSEGLRDRDVMARVRAAVLPHAARAGVSSPTSVHAVAVADHQAAEDVVSGSIIGDHSPVIVVQMTGGPFTAPHHRPGDAAPQGAVMTVTLDAATYRVTDIGYTAVAPDLSQIDGDVVDLLAP